MLHGGGRRAAAFLALPFMVCSACAGASMVPQESGGASGAGGRGASGGGAGVEEAGTGGLTIVGGAAGTSGGAGGSFTGGGGSSTCPSCPEGEYGVVVRGDGADVVLARNAPSDRDCPAEPLRGARAGCGGSSIYLSACETNPGDGVCLEVRGRTATYTQRSGVVWSGDATLTTSNTAPAGSDAGALKLELRDDTGRTLTLGVDFSYCSDAYLIRVVC